MTHDQSQDPRRQPRRLIPLTKWNDYHPWPTIGGLRHLAFHAGSNGFDRVVRRASNRLLIDEQKFFEWVDARSSDNSGKTIGEG